MSALGKLLYDGRIAADMSQMGVARATTLPQSSVSRYEAGIVTPPDGVIRELARLYGIDAGPLLAAKYQATVPEELTVLVHEQAV